MANLFNHIKSNRQFTPGLYSVVSSMASFNASSLESFFNFKGDDDGNSELRSSTAMTITGS